MERRLSAFLLSLCLVGSVCAEAPVYFADARLKAAVESELWITDPTPQDMLGLTSLYADGRGITSLTGLEFAKNLEDLELAYNQITSISPLGDLSSLKYLVLNNNPLGDTSAISGLTTLTYLDVHDTGLSDLSSLSSLSNLRTLILRFNHLSDLSPLSGLSALEDLDLRTSEITDLSGLSGLSSLTSLNVGDNRISDLSPLSGSTNLWSLYLEHNRISDLAALSSLTELQTLNLYDNDISDISPLGTLESLAELNLGDNPLNEEACDIYIPQIKENNPGISLSYTTFCNGRLRLSSTAGGSITSPGEGEFICKRGETVLIEAQADPGFVFANFSGSTLTPDNPIIVTMSQDQEIRAHFVSLSSTLHVDDDAAGDPKENGTAEHPFDSVQEAIEVAGDGATVFVRAGTYRECIDLLGKRIELTGFDPNDPSVAAWPVLDGGGMDTVVSFTNGEDPDCLLAGFVLVAGNGRTAGAIRCAGSSPTVANCLIVGNRVNESEGAAVYCTDSHATFINCTIADNYSGIDGGGLYLRNSPVVVQNSILWRNWPAQILSVDSSASLIRYSMVTGGCPGLGNQTCDPQFVAAGHWSLRGWPRVTVAPDDPNAVWVMGDYHLQSQAGRWDSKAGQWRRDEAMSPCIDSGDPATPVGREPLPNGGIINLGAYGGTAEASKSPRGTPSL